MLIEIQGEHTGSITMFGDVAIKLLKMMGQSGNPEGAVRAEEVSDALTTLQAALEKFEEPEPAAHTENEDEEDDSRISLATRARPLIDLLQSNADQHGYVMWKEK